VAERQQIQKPDRRERLRVFSIFQNLAFDGDYVREDVAMLDDDTLGLGCRTGRKQNLGGVVACDLNRRERRCRGVVMDRGKFPDRYSSD
jgi:hypothetical protein